MCKNICGKRKSDKRIVIYYTFIFFLTLYISMVAKRVNDYLSIKNNINDKTVTTYSIIDDYRTWIYTSYGMEKFHDFMIKYNYSYVIIFMFTFIWLVFYSKMILKILKRYLIICSLYTLFHSITLMSTIYYRSYKFCTYTPKYYDIWGMFRCYTYKENFLLFSLIMLYIFNRYHTSEFIRITFITLNFINLYFSLIAEQIFLNQVLESIVISFLFWALYDNPYFFKNSKKNDITREKKKKKEIELEIQKSKLYENVININDF